MLKYAHFVQIGVTMRSLKLMVGLVLMIIQAACAAQYSVQQPLNSSYLRYNSTSNNTPTCEQLSHPDSRASCIENRNRIEAAEQKLDEATLQLPDFNAANHTTYKGSGDSVIIGQAFLRQRGGGVVTCAGSDVMLMPATHYFRERFRLSFLRKKNA